MNPLIHPSAEVSPGADIGAGTRVWHQAQIRQGARLGADCVVGKGVYIDFDVVIGSRCKLQNSVYVYHGVTVEDGVFLGPGVMLLNDKTPRAVNPDGSLKSETDWTVFSLHIGYGAAIGGGAIVSPGVTIGKWASVGAGALVTKNIPAYGLAYGSPARLVGYVCPCGRRHKTDEKLAHVTESVCSGCGAAVPEELRETADAAAGAPGPDRAATTPADGVRELVGGGREFAAGGRAAGEVGHPAKPARRDVADRRGALKS